MATLMKRLPRPLRGILRSEDGNASIEILFWLPFFMFFMAFIADVSLILHSQARVLRIVQDENRNYSSGFYAGLEKTPKEMARDAIIQRIAAENLSDSVDADRVQILYGAGSGAESGMIETTVWVPMADIDALGVVSAIAAMDLPVYSQQVMEN